MKFKWARYTIINTLSCHCTMNMLFWSLLALELNFLSNQINISQLEYDDDKSPVYEDSKNSFSSSGVENIFVASE